MTSQPSTLAYDASLNRDGLNIEQTENFFRLITPALRSWRLLSAGWWVGIGALIYLGVFPLIMALFVVPRSDRLATIGVSTPYTCLLCITVFAAISKLNRRYIFEIAHDSFAMKRVELVRSTHTYVYRRHAISSIHSGLEPGHLIIHIRGEEMINLQLSKHREFAENVAAALNRGMQIPMQATTRELVAETEADAKRAAIERRRAFLCATFVVFGIGIVLAILIHPVVLWPTLLLASVPAGLAMGTQEKKFWV